MQLEDYFDFVSIDEIRLRGTRVGIEAVLREYSDGVLPEEIALNYPPLTLEQVHATITYCLGNRPQIDQYVERWLRGGRVWSVSRKPGAFLRFRTGHPVRKVRT